jgi:hypothetical protein
MPQPDPNAQPKPGYHEATADPELSDRGTRHLPA